MSFPPTTIDYHGNTGVAIEDPGELSVDRNLVATCSAVFRAPVAKWAELPFVGSVHPIFTTLQAVQIRTRLKGPYAYASLDYEGFHPKSGGGLDTTPTYELVRGLSEDPIETHPFFDTFAGTATNPLNGAIFQNAGLGAAGWAWEGHGASDDKGYLFYGFAVTNNEGKTSDFAKMDAYLNASKTTWRKSWLSRKPPKSDVKAGRIDQPDGPAPDIGEATWLNMGMTSVQRGSVYQLTEEWMASGPRGWNKQVYYN